MKQITLGDSDLSSSLRAERDGQWLAHAVRDDTGEPFGIECAGATGEAALIGWTDALARMAARARGGAGGAAAAPSVRIIERSPAAPSRTRPTVRRAIELQKESLEAVEVGARVRLDEVRARKPSE